MASNIAMSKGVFGFYMWQQKYYDMAEAFDKTAMGIGVDSKSMEQADEEIKLVFDCLAKDIGILSRDCSELRFNLSTIYPFQPSSLTFLVALLGAQLKCRTICPPYVILAACL